MLIEFRVENHRSLKTEQVLTMEAGRVDGDATIPRAVPGYSKPLLPVAALYGANASGKSNVLSALEFMRKAINDSHRVWQPDAGVPSNPYAWGAGLDTRSMYEATFVQKGVRYRYGFVVSSERIEEEWLHAWPNGKQQMWFERDGQEFTFGDNLKGERRLIQEVTRPNSLFLSVADQHRHVQLNQVMSWFRRIGIVDESGPKLLVTFMTFLNSSPKNVDSDGSVESFIQQIRNLLTKADIGISDLKYGRWRRTSPKPQREVEETFLLKHQGDNPDAWLPLEEESKGTQTLFKIGEPLLYALNNGGVLLVDELEASLHPKLAIEIIKQFNNPKTNPKNAQLIFTTHDTNLLGNDTGEPVLRRDQVWLTEKDKEGATTLYPLTDFKPRKAENVERGYLQGRYGAIPYLGNFSLLGKDAT